MQLLNLILIGVLSTVGSHAQARGQLTPLSVCELVAKRMEYNGRMVAVRGEERGGSHGAWLVGCSECQDRLVTRGVEWPNVIFLTYPDNESRNKANHADFRVDWRSIEAARKVVARSALNLSTDRIIQTYLGRFVAYPDLDNRVSPGVPGALRLGFGPVGLEAPAQLLIKRVRDVVVLHGTVRLNRGCQ
jgi:hypothetical protein